MASCLRKFCLFSKMFIFTSKMLSYSSMTFFKNFHFHVDIDVIHQYVVFGKKMFSFVPQSMTYISMTFFLLKFFKKIHFHGNIIHSPSFFDVFKKVHICAIIEVIQQNGVFCKNFDVFPKMFIFVPKWKSYISMMFFVKMLRF